MSDTPTPTAPDVPAPGVAVDQPTAAPTPKWIAGVSSGGGVLLLVWLAGLFGIELSPEVAGALVLAAGGAAAWLKRNKAVVVDVLDHGRGGQHLDRNGDGLADR